MATEAEVKTGWQPISTVPKDGRPVLLFGTPRHGFPNKIQAVGFFITGNGCLIAGHGTQGASSIRASHWMPLPPEPTLQPLK